MNQTSRDASTRTTRANPLAIVGMGCLFPKANSLETYWANIKASVDAITDIPPSHWRPEDYFDADPSRADMTYAQRGGFLEPIDFDPLRYGINPNNIEATDTTQLLGMVVADHALRDAGYQPTPEDDGRPLDRARTSVILGVTGALELVIPLGARLGHPLWRKALADAGVEGDVAERVMQQIAEGYVPWQENSFPGLLGNVAAGRIANRFNLQGTNCVVDAACASSLSAVHLAAMELETGRADTVVAGGLDTFNSIFMYMCFSKTPALSPTGNSRPFSADCDGTILGEGLGVVVLKRLADAERDGDRVYALIRGMGTSSDGRGNAVYAPSANGQAIALRAAYADADVSPTSIELLEAHGTGTSVGDATEMKALAEVYREASPDETWCAVGSVKSMIGHTKAAAGVAGLIKATMALHHKVLPPTIKVEQPLDALKPNTAPVYLNTHTRPWLPRKEHPRRAAVSAFGFGGSNFHCVLEEAASAKPAIEWDDRVLLHPVSAESASELSRALDAFEVAQSWPERQLSAAACRREFDIAQPDRLVLVATRDDTDLSKLVHGARRMLHERGDQLSWNTPEGAFFGHGAASGKLAALFPGQGAQRPDMLRDLACSFPAMLDAFALADDSFASQQPAQGAIHRSLSRFIFPIPVFDDAARGEQIDALRATQVAQPALGAADSGLWRVLGNFGVKADAAAGHSFGELVALFAADVIDQQTLLDLAVARGALMAAGTGDRGAMLAVAADREVVEEYLAKSKLPLVVANHNMPTQVVLSGATQAIETAAEDLKRQDVDCRRLLVSGAFHSSLVAGAESELAKRLDKVAWHEGRFPVYANTTGQVYPTEPQRARELLATQLARPVEFVRQIEQMYADGVTTFIEVGPGKVLSGLVRAILRDRSHHAIAVDQSRGRKLGQFDLACALGHLAALGHRVELQPWNPNASQPAGSATGRKPSITIPLTGANYIKPRPKQSPDATSKAVATQHGKVSEPMSTPTPPSRDRQASRPLAANTGNVASRPSSTQAAESPATPTAPANRESSEPSGNTTLPPSPAPPLAPSALTDAMRVTQQSIVALEGMQQRNAELQRQFLEGQHTAQRTIARLVDQQQQLLGASLGIAPSLPTFTAPVPEPIAPPPPAASSTVAHAVEAGAPIPQPSDARSSTVPEEHAPQAGIPDPAPQPVIVEPQAVAPQETATSAVLLEVVAEKTGYPVDMLNLEMSLDADLGIDSIKRVEILSALQERLPEVPPVESDELGGFETLGHVLARLQTTTVASPVAVVTSNSTGPDISELAVLEVVAEKTGYPVDMLELDMSLDADLGIDSIKRVEILSALQERLPEAPIVKSEDLGKFDSLRQVVEFVRQGHSPRQSEPTPTESTGEISSPTESDGTVSRLALRLRPLDDSHRGEAISLSTSATVWIADDRTELAQQLSTVLQNRGIDTQVVSLEEPPTDVKELSGLILLAPPQPQHAFVAQAFELLRRVGPTLRKADRQNKTLLAGVSRLDGAFGLIDASLDNAIGASLIGMIKTARHEWPEVLCRAIDVVHNWDNARAIAEALADELLREGPIETGLRLDGTLTLSLDETPPVPRQDDDSPLHPGDVVVVSGGARGVTAEVAIAMAAEYRPTLILIGRTPLPAEEPAWLHGVVGEAGIKRVIATNQVQAIAPRQLETEYRRIAAAREVRDTLRRVEEAGGRAIYRALDVRDPTAVQELLREARQQGPVRGLVHGAGVLADRLIEDKTTEQFNDVYLTKVDGLQALLDATREDDLSVVAFFSSSTARYGRKGQVDYAAANEVLNKQAHIEAHRRPGCRVVSINWGPWDGGMVTPALKQLFADEGVGVISVAAGARQFLDEINADPTDAVEVVVIGQLEKPAASNPSNDAAKLPPPTGESMNVAFERELDIETYPVLRSHVLKGRAVLPVAIIVEWLAHGAVHDNPGMEFHGFDNLEIFKGVIVHPGERVSLQIVAGLSQAAQGFERVLVQLRGSETLHAQAQIVLATALPKAKPSLNIDSNDPSARNLSGFYDDGRLFHGPDLQGIEHVDVATEAGAVAHVKCSPLPSVWTKQALRSTWLSDPLAIDAAFQLMILWCHEFRGCGSLPASITRYRQYERDFGADRVQVIMRVDHWAEHNATATMEFVDHSGRLVARIEGYQCVMDASLADAFAQNRLAEQLQS